MTANGLNRRDGFRSTFQLHHFTEIGPQGGDDAQCIDRGRQLREVDFSLTGIEQFSSRKIVQLAIFKLRMQHRLASLSRIGRHSQDARLLSC